MISKARSFAQRFYSVPWCVPAWGRDEFFATATSFLTGSVVHGSSAEQFSAAVREYLGMKFALPVNRGRTAIELGLRAMGIGDGDDVVMPSYVCRSVIDAVLRTGAKPVFADIDETLNVTASSVAAALSNRTKCVIVAHLFGSPAAIDEIEVLLAGSGVALMDDAAQALGARRGGRMVGSFGACGIVSCGPGKPLAGAAGGILVTNDPELYQRAAALESGFETASEVGTRAIRFWVWRRMRRYTLPFQILIDRLGIAGAEPVHVNAPLSNLDGAIALAQLQSLERNAADRRRNAEILTHRLSMLPGKAITDTSPDGMPVKFVHLLPVGAPTVAEVVALLADSGIEAQGGYSPLHGSDCSDADLPNTAALWRRVVCIPIETRSTVMKPVRFTNRAGPSRVMSAAPTIRPTSA